MGTPAIAAGLVLLFLALRLSRLLDRKEDARAVHPPDLTIRLKPDNALVRAVTRVCLIIALAGVAAAVVFLAAGSVGTTLALVLVSLGLPALAAFNFRLAHGGTLEIGPGGLVVRARNATHEYPWHHIEALRVTSWSALGRAQHAIIRATGAQAAEPFLQLRLRRGVSMSTGLWKSRYGTDVSGIPMFVKRIMLFVDDPVALAQRAQPYLDAAHAPDTAAFPFPSSGG